MSRALGSKKRSPDHVHTKPSRQHKVEKYELEFSSELKQRLRDRLDNDLDSCASTLTVPLSAAAVFTPVYFASINVASTTVPYTSNANTVSKFTSPFTTSFVPESNTLQISQEINKLNILNLKSEAEELKVTDPQLAVTKLDEALHILLDGNKFTEEIDVNPLQIFDIGEYNFVHYERRVLIALRILQRWFKSLYDRRVRAARIIRSLWKKSEYIQNKPRYYEKIVTVQCAKVIQNKFKRRLKWRNAMAKRVQRWYLRKKNYPNLIRNVIRPAIILIQSKVRAWLLRKSFFKFLRVSRAATRIQKHFRGYTVRSYRYRLVSAFTRLLHAEAVTIQKSMRSFLAANKCIKKMRALLAAETDRSRSERKYLLNQKSIDQLHFRRYLKSWPGKLFLLDKYARETKVIAKDAFVYAEEAADVSFGRVVDMICSGVDRKRTFEIPLENIDLIFDALHIPRELYTKVYLLSNGTGSINSSVFKDWLTLHLQGRFHSHSLFSDIDRISFRCRKSARIRARVLLTVLNDFAGAMEVCHSVVYRSTQVHPNYACCQCDTAFALFSLYKSHFLQNGVCPLTAKIAYIVKDRNYKDWKLQLQYESETFRSRMEETIVNKAIQRQTFLEISLWKNREYIAEQLKLAPQEVYDTVGKYLELPSEEFLHVSIYDLFPADELHPRYKAQINDIIISIANLNKEGFTSPKLHYILSRRRKHGILLLKVVNCIIVCFETAIIATLRFRYTHPIKHVSPSKSSIDDLDFPSVATYLKKLYSFLNPTNSKRISSIHRLKFLSYDPISRDMIKGFTDYISFPSNSCEGALKDCTSNILNGVPSDVTMKLCSNLSQYSQSNQKCPMIVRLTLLMKICRGRSLLAAFLNGNRHASQVWHCVSAFEKAAHSANEIILQTTIQDHSSDVCDRCQSQIEVSILTKEAFDKAEYFAAEKSSLKSSASIAKSKYLPHLKALRLMISGISVDRTKFRLSDEVNIGVIRLILYSIDINNKGLFSYQKVVHIFNLFGYTPSAPLMKSSYQALTAEEIVQVMVNDLYSVSILMDSSIFQSNKVYSMFGICTSFERKYFRTISLIESTPSTSFRPIESENEGIIRSQLKILAEEDVFAQSTLGRVRNYSYALVLRNIWEKTGNSVETQSLGSLAEYVYYIHSPFPSRGMMKSELRYALCFMRQCGCISLELVSQAAHDWDDYDWMSKDDFVRLITANELGDKMTQKIMRPSLESFYLDAREHLQSKLRQNAIVAWKEKGTAFNLGDDFLYICRVNALYRVARTIHVLRISKETAFTELSKELAPLYYLCHHGISLNELQRDCMVEDLFSYFGSELRSQEVTSLSAHTVSSNNYIRTFFSRCKRMLHTSKISASYRLFIRLQIAIIRGVEVESVALDIMDSCGVR